MYSKTPSLSPPGRITRPRKRSPVIQNRARIRNINLVSLRKETDQQPKRPDDIAGMAFEVLLTGISERTAGNTLFFMPEKAIAWFRQCRPPSEIILDVTLKFASVGSRPTGMGKAPVDGREERLRPRRVEISERALSREGGAGQIPPLKHIQLSHTGQLIPSILASSHPTAPKTGFEILLHKSSIRP
ncbi:hypothetical protein VTL71DRAFT_16421 [Oculimacula yallundae]|uniref:Uncharacterized protein n=1 Tax=Oculimacula yallundae TaxID=86028 RepID=A0ABR4CEJ1_9HELO